MSADNARPDREPVDPPRRSCGCPPIAHRQRHLHPEACAAADAVLALIPAPPARPEVAREAAEALLRTLNFRDLPYENALRITEAHLLRFALLHAAPAPTHCPRCDNHLGMAGECDDCPEDSCEDCGGIDKHMNGCPHLPRS